MVKKMFKILALLISAAMALSALVGFTPSATEKQKLPIVDKPIVLTVWKQNVNKVDYNENMEMWKRAGERTNIIIKFKTIPEGTSDNVKTALALEVAAGVQCDIYII